jgi:hypothetical protein
MKIMSEQSDFVPMSPQLGVAGSSYRLQMGMVNGFWAIRLAKGNDVLESHVFKDEEKGEMPNANRITGWTLSVLTIPNINTFQIQKTVGFVRQKAMEAFEDHKRKKATQGKAEAQSATLEKVPEDVAVKRIQGPGGWVKDDVPAKTPASEETTVDSQPAASIAEPVKLEPTKPEPTPSPPVETQNSASPAASNTVTSKNGRVLQMIPRGEGFQANSTTATTSAKATAPNINSESPVVAPKSTEKSIPVGSQTGDLESRVVSLEKRVAELEAIIKELRK